MIKKHKIKLLLICLLCLSKICIAKDIVYTDRDIIRNGNFEESQYTEWYDVWCDFESDAAIEGKYGMQMNDSAVYREYSYFFQKLTVPSQLNSASIRFDYRTVLKTNDGTDPVEFQVCIAKSKGFESDGLYEDDKPPPVETIGIIHSETVDAAIDWKVFESTLDQALITETQKAHDAGEFVFILFALKRLKEKKSYEVHIDNLSFKVTGIQHVPKMQGKIAYIAYIEEDENDFSQTINILDPNTCEKNGIWTYPDHFVYPSTDLRWKPDATELAFNSDHETAYSSINKDIYAIKPNGSGLRRITNGPSNEEIVNKNYPRITVTGKVRAQIHDANAPPLVYSLYLCIKGLKEPYLITISDNEEVSFTIPDVAVLDEPDMFDQTIVVRWSSSECYYGMEYLNPMAEVTNSTADVGTLIFDAYHCVTHGGAVSAYGLSWKFDGSEIGFELLGDLKKIKAGGELGTGDRLETDEGYFPGAMSWSPVDSGFLYHAFRNLSGGTAIYLAPEKGKTQLLLKQVMSVAPAWLPDGSGFVYINNYSEDSNIYYYDIATKQQTRLTYFPQAVVIETLSISPDGRHILFQKIDKLPRPYKSDLWILDRLNPAEIWQITDEGNCESPDWSRKDVVIDKPDNPDDPDNPDNPDNPENPNNSESGNGGGGGGGGCFIEIMN